jgi:hypothetical protein
MTVGRLAEIVNHCHLASVLVSSGAHLSDTGVNDR